MPSIMISDAEARHRMMILKQFEHERPLSLLAFQDMADKQQPFTTSTFALEGSEAASKRRKTVRGSRACDKCRHKKSEFVLLVYES